MHSRDAASGSQRIGQLRGHLQSFRRSSKLADLGVPLNTPGHVSTGIACSSTTDLSETYACWMQAFCERGMLGQTYLVVAAILSAGLQSSLFSHVHPDRRDLSMFGRDRRKVFGRVVAPFGVVRTSRVEAVGGGSVDLALVDSSRAVRVAETVFGLVAREEGWIGVPFEVGSTATVVASLYNQRMRQRLECRWCRRLLGTGCECSRWTYSLSSEGAPRQQCFGEVECETETGTGRRTRKKGGAGPGCDHPACFA